MAAAESGLKTAQAALEAATHNGTQEQQQASAAEVTRARIDRDQAQRDLNALIKLNATGRCLRKRGGRRTATARLRERLA